MNDRIGQGEAGKNIFGSNVTLDTFNNRVFKHQVFGVGRRFAIPASPAVVDIIIDPTENGVFPKDTLVFLPFKVKTFGAGPIEIDVYENPTSTATGTLWPLGDRNRVNPVTPHTVIRLNPTVTDPGVNAIQDESDSVAGQGNQADLGGETKEDLIFKVNPGIKYLVRIANTSGEVGRGVFTLNLFEV